MPCSYKFFATSLQLVAPVAHDLHQFRLKDKHRILRDRSHRSIPIRPLGLDGERTLLALAHVFQAFVPTPNDLPRAERQREGRVAVVRRVELRACNTYQNKLRRCHNLNDGNDEPSTNVPL
jgi:hypothetical protein